MKDEETSESEAALDLVSGQFVDLCIGQVLGAPEWMEIYVPQQQARRTFV